MPNILFVPTNEVFKTDILDQIKHHAPEFNIVDKPEMADVIVIDENKVALQNMIDQGFKAPLIFLTSEDDFSVDNTYVMAKPFSLSRFLDSIKAAINIF